MKMENTIRYWRTQYYRYNFAFSPPLEQRADVVFKTDIPFDDEHLEDFKDVAANALYKQNKHWTNYSGPFNTGWSSTLGGNEFHEIDPPKKQAM